MPELTNDTATDWSSAQVGDLLAFEGITYKVGLVSSLETQKSKGLLNIAREWEKHHITADIYVTRPKGAKTTSSASGRSRTAGTSGA